MHRVLRRRIVAALAVALTAAVAPVASQAPIETAPFDEHLFTGLSWRNLGPYRAGAWISDIAVPDAPAEAHLYTIYVASRNGGVWKTTNNGTTFQPIFDEHEVLSIGAIALAPSRPDTLWVGTGEASNARSSYPGSGIYRSDDGGRTWRHAGLTDTRHIARIVVHPTDPNVVYVAAMGHLWTPNTERGVFKTTDGGATWTKVLYVDDRTGAIDLVLDRTNPDVLLAAMYQRTRRPWTFDDGGPGSGIHRTTNGGRTWTRIDNGLPTGRVGRIGLAVHHRDPRVVYAIVDNRNQRPATEEEGRRDRERSLDPQPRTVGGALYRSDDGGVSWRRASAENVDLAAKAGYSFAQVRVDPMNDQRVYVTGETLASTEDGGTTWADVEWPAKKRFAKAFGDVRSLWVDHANPDRIILGSDGGICISYDGGPTCDFHDNLPLGEVYAIGVDMDDPYRVYAGLQDHEMWRGPVNAWWGKVGLEDWITVGAGDGMYTQVDSTDSRWLYTTSQFGDHRRVDQAARLRTRIAPTRPKEAPALRFNWTAPIRLSPHDPRTVYAGAQVLLRSRDRGDSWDEISPDLTTNDAERIAQTGPAIRFCTITTIDESPVRPGLIWLGTDDGKVQVTRDSGGSWTDLTAAVAAAGGPEGTWVTRVFASPHDADTAYVAKSALRDDDLRPFLFKTSDAGRTWVAITRGLPERSVNVVIEDRVTQGLMFAGTDIGVYVSIDGGARWARMRGSMPNVPVTDLVVHPREGDLVVATYGRGLFVMDVTWLREVSEEMLGRDAHLFSPEPGGERRDDPWGNYELYGDRHITTPNEPEGIVVTYYLRTDATVTPRVRVADRDGREVRAIDGPARAGINTVVWDLLDADKKRVKAGDYRVTLEAAGQAATKPARVLEPRAIVP